MKAVIPAAGLGTRFLPVTRVVPKEMLPIGSRPALEHIVEEARQAGAERQSGSQHHGGEWFGEQFDGHAYPFLFRVRIAGRARKRSAKSPCSPKAGAARTRVRNPTSA